MTRRPVRFLVAIFLSISSADGAVAQGRWTYGSSKDEMTDVLRVHISGTSSPTSNSSGRAIRGTLVWRCSADYGQEVFLLLGTYFVGNSDDQVLVEARFDSEPAADGVLWNQSTNNRGAFLASDDIEGFTDHVKDSRRLLLRVTDPADAEAITYTFNLQGFTAAYRRIEATCAASKRQSNLVDSLQGVVNDLNGTEIPSEPDQVYMESVVEERPEVVSGPRLQYPDLFRQASIQGRVLVQAIIDTTGRAEAPSVKVIQSPNPGFDQPAKNYMLRALFRPARVHGRAVRVLINLPIDFSIKR